MNMPFSVVNILERVLKPPRRYSKYSNVYGLDPRLSHTLSLVHTAFTRGYPIG